MTMSDPIADMLTRIRNANTAKHDTVDVPASKMKVAIADILVNEGYIVKYDLIDEGSFKTIRITLKYGADKNEKVITGLKRISKPGLRVYAGKEDLPKVLGGLGTAIISTNQGVVTDKKQKARRRRRSSLLCVVDRKHLAKASLRRRLSFSARPFFELGEVLSSLAKRTSLYRGYNPSSN